MAFVAPTSLTTPPALTDIEAASCDVLVVGSGASGLATAVAACMHGLDVQVIEKDALVGGSTALSYGTLWVPGSAAAQRAGIQDEPGAALTYLRHEMGAQFDESRARAYLLHAPRMLDFFEHHGGVPFFCREGFPDHHPDVPGASSGGRTVCVAPFDGRELGRAVALLRPPLPTQTWLGMMYTPAEVKMLQSFSRSWPAFRHVAARLARHVYDRARHGRTLWLTNGNALVARLLKTALGLKIPISTSSPLQRLWIEGGRVVGAVLEQEGRPLRLRARRGVVLACGGFGGNAALCAQLFERPQLDGRNWSLASDANSGDGLRVAMAAGGQLERDVQTSAFWAPVSQSPGHPELLAGHFHDRHRPGFLAVDAHGQRFADEALSNHHFAEAIVRSAEPGAQPLVHLLCDHRSLRRVGCGDLIHPWPARLGPHLRSAYLMRADTVAGLAALIGVPPHTLEQTVREFNAHAREGRDPAFGKGANAFGRYYGDERHHPNPCLGPLEHGPFYAVRLTAGHMGTLVGLKTDLRARVLGANGKPIAGLHAVGNDATNVFAGACPGGGITLGPGMTFAHIAAQHLAGVALEGVGERDDEAAAPRAALAA